MNILLINPPTDNMITSILPSVIEKERGYNPPLGLLYIAAYLEKNTTHKVEILDTQVEEMDYRVLKDVITQKKPAVVGITAMTFTLLDVIKVAHIVKSVDERIRVVLGGPHVNIYPYESINLPCIDFLVLGEGEVAFTELVEHITNINKLKEVKGLVFKINGNIINTGIRELMDNLDELPFPARHLTPYMKYSSALAKRMPITTMITSRGCPYKCTFCDRPHLGKRFRARTAQNVVDEMEECVKMGINEFLIYDDTFTVNKRRVIAICDEIIRRRLDIGWDIRARIDTVDKKMLEKLKEANCERIHYGVEAGTDSILSVLRKGITVAQAKNIFNLTKEVGISTLAYFMFGSPTETRHDILQTIELAKELHPDYVHFSILIPFPSTPLYKDGLEKGIFKNDYWQQFAANPSQGFQTRYWEENLSGGELLNLLEVAYKSFYFRPLYILKKIAEIRSVNEFKRKIKGALKLLKL